MTINEIKQALYQLRNEISLIEIDNPNAALNAAWEHIADAMAELEQAERELVENAKPVTVNCTNYFNDVGKQRLAEALQDGKTVSIYIDCIGHTRSAYETREYIKWLHDYYGARLEVIPQGGNMGQDVYRLNSSKHS